MKLLFLAMAIAISLSCTANNFYISTLSGDDSRSEILAQDPETPWQSIDRLNMFTGLQPGDSILFKRGEVFYGAIQVRKFGSSGNDIAYGSYGSGANPVITGFKTMDDWTLLKDNIYFTSLDVDNLNIVNIDGITRGMGRYPNSGYLKVASHVNNSSISGDLSADTNWTGAEVVIRKYRWIIDRHTITSQVGNTLNYNALMRYGNNSAYFPVDGNGFFIQNHLATLDQFGEWYYDASEKRLYVKFEADGPANHTVTAGTKTYNFSLTNGGNVSLNDLDFQGANLYGIYMINCENVNIRNCNLASQGGTAIYGGTLNHVTVDGGEINSSLSNGIFFEYEANNCNVHNVSIDKTNLIAGSGRSGDGVGSGISIRGDYTTVSDNRIKNSGFNGIHFVGNNILIERNYVDSFCLTKDDGGGIYTFQEPPTINNNITIRNNIVLNAIGTFEGVESYYYESFGKAASIYLDGYSNNCDISGNTLAHGKWAGIFVNNNFNHNITRNTVYDISKGLYIIAYNSQTRNVRWKANKFVAKTNDQATLYIETSVRDNIADLASADSNYYSRPTNDDKTIVIDSRYGGGTGAVNHTLSQWQSRYSEDRNSKKSPITSAADGDVLFEYNATNNKKVIPLSDAYVDLENNEYTTVLVLEPFTSIILIKQSQRILPVSMLSVDGRQQENGILLEWVTSGEINMDRYDIERSINGRSFEKIGTKSSMEVASKWRYQWLDTSPAEANNYYRLQKINKDGSFDYSPVVLVGRKSSTSNISVFPNPVSSNTFRLNVSGLKSGNYILKLFKGGGQEIYSAALESATGNIAETVVVNRWLGSGNYIVQLSGQNVVLSQNILKL